MDDQALNVARRYHEGWTTRNYALAIDLLAEDVIVEVPINDYPTKNSFADALRGFGNLVGNSELLAAMSDNDEAMLLYDLRVEQLGTLRVVEHFTVTDGRITRLRQIHDTAPIRAWAALPEAAKRAGSQPRVKPETQRIDRPGARPRESFSEAHSTLP